MIRCPVRDKHVECQQEPGETRCKANHQKQATEELKTRYKVGIEGGKRNVKAHEEAGDFCDVVHLSPTGLDKLPTPVKAHSKQKRRSQIRDLFCGKRVVAKQV